MTVFVLKKSHYGLFESSINNSLVPKKSESAHPCRGNLIDTLECLFTSLKYLSMYFSVSYQLHFRDCAQIGRGPLVGLPLSWSCSQTDNEAQIGRPSAQSSVNPSAPKYLAKKYLQTPATNMFRIIKTNTNNIHLL